MRDLVLVCVCSFAAEPASDGSFNITLTPWDSYSCTLGDLESNESDFRYSTAGERRCTIFFLDDEEMNKIPSWNRPSDCGARLKDDLAGLF